DRLGLCRLRDLDSQHPALEVGLDLLRPDLARQLDAAREVAEPQLAAQELTLLRAVLVLVARDDVEHSVMEGHLDVLGVEAWDGCLDLIRAACVDDVERQVPSGLRPVLVRSHRAPTEEIAEQRVAVQRSKQISDWTPTRDCHLAYLLLSPVQGLKFRCLRVNYHARRGAKQGGGPGPRARRHRRFTCPPPSRPPAPPAAPPTRPPPRPCP